MSPQPIICLVYNPHTTPPFTWGARHGLDMGSISGMFQSSFHPHLKECRSLQDATWLNISPTGRTTNIPPCLQPSGICVIILSLLHGSVRFCKSAIMIEDILKHTSPLNIAIAAITVYIVLKITGWVRVELRIRALGGRAPKIRTYLPWGIDPFPRCTK